ncbi:MAG: PHP domain-containing protein [Anaerolineae bacterium]|nr:PHP domain-containing protein [Anaerolineae bacterium]
MERFVQRPDVARVLGHGDTKSSVELLHGVQADLRILPPERYGTALSYFTGSQAHNIRLREMARQRGLSLNEHEFSHLEGEGAPILCATEEAVYAMLDLPWIPPELREDRGEIEAAQAGSLPQLIRLADIRGDFHMHTTASDGLLSLREMVEAARARGLRCIVITDHSRSQRIANGLTIERLLEQQQAVRAIDAEYSDITVLHGSEVDILPDGTLDFPDEVLAQLDLVVASLHLSLDQPREKVTARMLNAVRNPHVDIIGHMRGQLIMRREPADLDMDVVLEAAQTSSVALEINANPARLDFGSCLCTARAEMGIKIAINTDAHSAADFELLPFGIGTARRAWLSAEQVINTGKLTDCWHG